MWLSLLSLHLIGIVGYNLLLRKSILDKTDKWLLATILQTGIGIPAIFLYILFPFQLPQFTPLDLFLLGAAVCLTIVLQALNVKALQYLEAGVYSVVYNTRIILVSILGVLLLSEQLSLLQILGGLLIFCSVFIVQQKASKRVTAIGLLLGFAAAVTLSFLNVTEKMLNQSVGFFEYFIPGTLIATIIMWGIVFLRKPKFSYSIFKQPQTISLMTLRAFSAYGFSGAIVFGPVAISNYISSLSVILMVICGALFLGERDHIVKKIIATGIAVVGLTLIVIGKV